MTLAEAKTKADAVVNRLADDLKKLRTGRAHPSMLDSVTVEAYGTKMPLNQVANVVTADAQLLQITPFDPSNLAAISAAIREDQQLGLNPADDGKVVRVPIPPLTQERRQLIVKQLSERVEEANVNLRNIRHEVLNAAKKQQQAKEISEDEQKRIEKQMNELMDNTKEQLDNLAKAKETEILTV